MPIVSRTALTAGPAGPPWALPRRPARPARPDDGHAKEHAHGFGNLRAPVVGAVQGSWALVLLAFYAMLASLAVIARRRMT